MNQNSDEHCKRRGYPRGRQWTMRRPTSNSRLQQ